MVGAEELASSEAQGLRNTCKEEVEALHSRLQELRDSEVCLGRLRDDWLQNVDHWVRRLEETIARCSQLGGRAASAVGSTSTAECVPASQVNGVANGHSKPQAPGSAIAVGSDVAIQPLVPSWRSDPHDLHARSNEACQASEAVFPPKPLEGLVSPASVGGWCSDAMEADVSWSNRSFSSGMADAKVVPLTSTASLLSLRGGDDSCAVPESSAKVGWALVNSPAKMRTASKSSVAQDFDPVLPGSTDASLQASKRPALANGCDPVVYLDKSRVAKNAKPLTASVAEETGSESAQAPAPRKSLLDNIAASVSSAGIWSACRRESSRRLPSIIQDVSTRPSGAFRTTVNQLEAISMPVVKGSFEIVEKPSFHVAVGVLIVCSTACNGIEAELLATGTPDADVAFFNWLQSFFAVCFAVEFVLRLGFQGREYFCGLESSWNIFDTLLVGLSAGEVYFMMGNPSKMSTNAFMQLSRVLRNFRLFRLMRHVGGLRHLIISLLGSLYTMANLTVLLATYIYMFAFCFTCATTSAELDHGAREELKSYFGSLGASCISLFKCMTNGISWGVVAEPLQSSNMGLFVLMCFYILIAVFALMNAVTSVFVENISAAQRKARDHLVNMELQMQQETVDKLQELFVATDEDGSGSISRKEFKCYMQDERAVAYLRTLGIDSSEADNLFDLLDVDGSGDVEIEEFVRGCLRIKGEAKSVEIKELHMDLKKVMRVLSFLTEKMLTAG